MLDANLPPFRGNIDFNAQHAPMGAYWNFTCGHFGSRGGFSLQHGKPGNQDIFIGAKRGPRSSDEPFVCLPFYQDEAQNSGVVPVPLSQMQRRYGWATDRWTTDDLEFTMYSPFGGIVDPIDTHPSMSRVCLMPAILATLTIDNTHGTQPKTGVFALKFNEPGVRMLNEQRGWRGKQRVGFGLGRQLGFQAMIENEPGDRGATMQPFLRTSIAEALDDSAPIHHLGDCGGISFEVPPGARRTLLVAFGAYLDGTITTRLEGKYYYTKHFADLYDVLDHALRGYDAIVAGSAELDRELLDTKLSPEQQFLISHATRSYYANTQLLDIAGEPFWVVNEGEYGMMNTLDLAVDQVFWELKQNPWVVRNLLDNYVRHYSYQDQIKIPRPMSEHSLAAASESEHDLSAGGVSFCHDMGAHGNFAPSGHSSYELPHRSGPFSYMTQEQLCNWILIAASYVARTGDLRWTQKQRELIGACMRSMLNREGADERAIGASDMIGATIAQAGSQAGAEPGDAKSRPSKRGGGGKQTLQESSAWRETAGTMRFDSARCGNGSEITTYDSLDPSLARARNSIYLAVKRVAAYLGLEFLFSRLGDTSCEEAAAQAAHKAADAVARRMNPEDGCLPAVFDPQSPAYKARVLPAVEALLFPWYWGTCDYGSEYKSSRAWLGNGNESFVAKLKRHAVALLSDPQKRNVFSDGGLKLSSTCENTWVSKIAIFQHVAREIFRLGDDPKMAETLRRADIAHMKWQTEGAAGAACADQFVNGQAVGSRFYPRCITTALWLDKSDEP
ncbi:hypothetical protein BH09PLA1_BH09PLA1_31360 [soil metagenome]